MQAYEDFLLNKLTQLPKLRHVETMIIQSSYNENHIHPMSASGE